MGLISCSTVRRHWVEWTLLLAVFASATGLGMAVLKDNRGPDGHSAVSCTISFLGRPLMIATGRGSFHPDIEATPELRPFLEHQEDRFDPATLPKEIAVSNDSAAEYHIYLGWAVALLWRVFGISWPVLEPLLAIALGLCAVFAYGLFRLGMNRWLSIAGTVLFVSSPAVLDQLNSLRDFSKAPFLLGGLLAIGWLVTRRAPMRFPRLFACLMGLIAGVGMGFRQDAIILVPVSLAAILFLSPCAVYRSIPRRIAAALVCMLAFLAAAAPMLTRMEGGAQPYHPLAQGYSMLHMDRCSLKPGVCEPLASSHDNFIFASIFSYARRASGDSKLYFRYNDPEDARYTRDWVIRTGLQFPADTIARGYGAILNVLCNADGTVATLRWHRSWSEVLAKIHRPVADFFRVAGLPFAVLALLAAAAASPPLAFILVLLILYFCGYVSLDNEWRHTFHLSFVCFWAAGFAVQQTLSMLRLTVKGTAQWGLWLRRAGLFLILGALALWVPWQAARFWQRHNIETVMGQYAAAPCSALPTQPRPLQDLTLFRIESGALDPAQSSDLAQLPYLGAFLRGASVRHWETRCTLYAVHLRARKAGHLFLAKYWGARDTGSPNDFSQVMRVMGSEADDGETWFFFPVYEFAYRTIFEGVAFTPDHADDFLGLYRVEDDAQPALLPCLTLNESNGSRRMTATLKVPYDGMQFFTPENELIQLAESTEMAKKLGRAGTAVFYAQVANALNPANEQRIRLASAWEKAGSLDNSQRILESAVLSSGGDLVSCAAMEQFLQRNSAAIPGRQVWKELAAQSTSVNLWRTYERLLDQNDTEERMHVYRQLLRITPDDLDSATKLQGLLDEKGERLEASGNLTGAVNLYREAIPLNPRNSQPGLHLEKALSKSSPAERREIWDALWRDNPGNALVAASCGSARAATGYLVGALECFAAARRIAPDEWCYCVTAGEALASAGAWKDAAEAYERALALNPKLDYLLSRLNEAKERAAAGSGPSNSLTQQVAAP